MAMDYYCYLLSNSSDHTYIGITNNLDIRLDQHNSILPGGAKATKKSTDWKFERILSGFDKSSAGSFEWYWKHVQKKDGKWRKTSSGIINKLKRLDCLLNENRWLNITIFF
jgi:predicted GIY-YIG superfamily endonuclease